MECARQVRPDKILDAGGRESRFQLRSGMLDPALLTRMSRRPNSFSIASAIADASSERDMSPGWTRAVPPCFAMRAATASRGSLRRPVNITLAPSSSSASAPASPIPLPAPVTHATFPPTASYTPLPSQTRRSVDFIPIQVDFYLYLYGHPGPTRPHQSDNQLLDATLKVVRAKGYSATRIEDVCAEAGLTKGSFFHHFKSKEDLALSAVAHWDATTSAFFAAAPYHDAADPLSRADRLYRVSQGDPDRRPARFHLLCGHDRPGGVSDSSGRERRLRAEHQRPRQGRSRPTSARRCAITAFAGAWTAESLALHILAVIQGGFILAKAQGSAAVAAETLDHLRRYIELLFGQGRKRRSRRRLFPKALTDQAVEKDIAIMRTMGSLFEADIPTSRYHKSRSAIVKHAGRL